MTSSGEDPLRSALRTAVRDVPVDDDLFGKVAEVARRRGRRRVALAGFAASAAIVAGAGATVFAVGPDEPDAQPAASANRTCPPDLEKWTRGPQRAGSTDVFVPDTPTTATLCSYAQPEGVHVTLGELSGKDVPDLATALNAAPDRPRRCPAQPHVVELLVRFHYEAGPDVDVTMDTDACFTASNGARYADVGSVTVPGYGAGSIPSSGQATPPSR